ncbi:MAG TPA: cytochrome c-type biogenesis CcmF C-terminal domain-containing protein [Candidatus Eisenbacteria bacterium]
MKRSEIATALALLVPVAIAGAVLTSIGALNWGQVACWLAFLAALTSGVAGLGVLAGRTDAAPVARTAFRVQWVGLVGGAFFLWWILFHHQFQYQYVHDYSSKDMPSYYVYAAFWGGQEGTFLLWALITTTLGLVLMRWKHALMQPAMFFLNLPVILLTFLGVTRGPFLHSAQAFTDGVGLNPLLQDYWMTIHPPILFTGFSSFVVPFAIACAALWKRDYDGWVKPVLPWVVFSTAIQATGFIMGGVWAYKVLGWGGYWGWDPVENGSFIPWLSNIGLLHGLLVQRVTGSLRRTNFFLAVTSYVLVLYASFLTRSGVLADFSVHSFAASDQWNLPFGLGGFLLLFVAMAAFVGYGLLISRLREIPRAAQALGAFSRESFLWLGQLVFMLMCLLVAVGMSAPLITRLFGPPSNVQTSYYNLVNAPLAIAMGLLLGIAPLLRWRQHEPEAFLRAVLPAAAFGLVVAIGAAVAGIRQAMPAGIVFAMAFALAANTMVTLRGFKASWKHGVAFLGHMGASVLVIGVIASSGYGVSEQVQLPRGQSRPVLGFDMKFEGMERDHEGKDHAIIAVVSPERNFTANAKFYWSDYNQGYMKKPHIERFLTHDVYISPLEMVGGANGAGTWFGMGESKQVGNVKYTFESFLPEPGDGKMKLTANLIADVGGRTVPLKPTLEISMADAKRTTTPAYLPSGGTVTIVNADPNNGGRVMLALPGAERSKDSETLAVEVSTKPFINLVWIGAIVMLASAFLSMIRRAQDVAREGAKA